MVQDSVVRFGVVDQRVILGSMEELEGARVLLVAGGESEIALHEFQGATTYIHCLRGGMIAGDVKGDRRSKKAKKWD